MKIAVIISILSLFHYISNGQATPNMGGLNNEDKILIDSSMKAGKGAFYYRLLFKSTNITREVYRVKNRDHSVEFKRKFYYKPLNYVCYEVYDLPTGVTWNILYDGNAQEFYLTDHYDMHAMGDTFMKKSVNFAEKTVKIMSFETKKPYRIRLVKL